MPLDCQPHAPALYGSGKGPPTRRGAGNCKLVKGVGQAQGTWAGAAMPAAGPIDGGAFRYTSHLQSTRQTCVQGESGGTSMYLESVSKIDQYVLG